MNQHLLDYLHERALWRRNAAFGSARIASPDYPEWPTNNFPFQARVHLSNPVAALLPI